MRIRQSGLGLASLSFVLLAAACAAPDTAGTDSDESAVLAKDGTFALAKTLPEQCAGPEIHRVERRVGSGFDAKRFSYGYRFKAPTVKGAPVLVYLPGGPGSASSEHPPAFLPEGWGYLLTDPRGVGCNTLAAVPGAHDASVFFRTEEIAADVVAAVRAEKLEDYIVYGLSYGTLLGTVVAHDLEQQKLPVPRALVLEGVLGKSFAETFVGAEYIHQWDRVRGVLPADVLTELDTKAAPYGITAEGWSRALTNFMPRGAVETANTVAALSTTQSAELQATAKSIFTELAEAHPHTDPGAVELYREVACREIADTVPASDLDVVFAGGKLVRNMAEDGTKCGALHLTAPFDSARYPSSAKVYYFVGADDVATPAWQGQYHFEHHDGHAVLVVTKGAGHNSLQYNQQACASKVMTSVAAGGADLESVLGACPLPVTVSVK